MSSPAAFGGYDDWPDHAGRTPHLPGQFGALFGIPTPPDVVVGGAPEGGGVRSREVHVRDGVRAVRLRWSVGFGPDLAAWLLHPVDADPATRPGVLALHSHGGIKSLGAERMVDLPGVPAHVLAYREQAEEGAAVASDLARSGFTVLAPDAFGWGARRFDLGVGDPQAYDVAAREHEHLVAKACALFDTSWAGMVAHDDLTSLAVLRTLCAPGPVGVLGFSGGGGRAALLAALDEQIGSVVVVAMMCTLASLYPDHVGHSWLLHTRGLASGPDLVGLLATNPARHVLVGYCARDRLFPLQGQRDADAALHQAFAAGPGSYTPVWADTDHVFTRALQRDATEHLHATLPPTISRTMDSTEERNP